MREEQSRVLQRNYSLTELHGDLAIMSKQINLIKQYLWTYYQNKKMNELA